MLDYIHIDEKWFYITKQKSNYYLIPDEQAPIGACKSKRYITKVMFMAAVARPRYDYHRKKNFDGKIGIWPFVFKERAKRSSHNRPAGTLETKVIQRINRDEIKKMFCDNIIPSIKEKWPIGHKTVIIQQDNAGPHTKEGDLDIAAACADDHFDINVICQPPNSPDFNVLDLGFFNSIQALQHQNAPRTIDELISCTENAFSNIKPESLNDVFLSLQKCMESAMKVGGGNDYKLPHLHKEKLRRNNSLPLSIQCCPETLMHCRNIINGDIPPGVHTPDINHYPQESELETCDPGTLALAADHESMDINSESIDLNDIFALRPISLV